MSRKIGALGAMVFLIAALPHCLTAPLAAQVFRAGTHIVPIDIAVLDKNRKPVTDLKQSDFTVFENNVRQQVSIFFPRRLAPLAGLRDPSPAEVRALSDEPVALPTRRTFLIVLGGGRMVGPGEQMQATIDFLRGTLLPQDLVAVMAFNRLTELSPSHEEAAQVVERYRDRHEELLRQMAEFYWCALCNRENDVPTPVQSGIDALFRPEEDTTPRLPLRSAAQLLLQSGELQPDYRLAVPGMAYGGPNQRPWNRTIIESDIRKLYAGIEYLRPIEGEKHLIWITGSGLADWRWSAQDDERLARWAGGARVAIDIYATRASGLWAAAAAERVSEMTGGQYTGVTAASELYSRVDQATRFGYLIGYAPTNPKRELTTRGITVKVNRPDVTVLFIHEYVAEPARSPAERRQHMITTRLKTSAAIGFENADIAVEARASFEPGANRRMLVSATIDPSTVFFEQANGQRSATLELRIYCGDAQEKLLGEAKQTLSLNLDDAEYQRYVRDGIPYSVQVPVSSEPMYVRVLAYDVGTDRMGSTTIKLR